MNSPGIDPRTVRHSPIAGTWYPGSKRELEETVDDFLAQAQSFPTGDELMALISPHAGYAYSGQTAAYAYRQLAGKAFDLVVLLGPGHAEDYGPLAISSKDYYATPLGEIELARDFIDRLAEKVTLNRVDQDGEHSLEIQLPFLQRTLGPFQLVPVMVTLPFYLMGESALEPCTRAANALAELARGRRALFVASSDLAHIPDYETVHLYDARTAALVEAFNPTELARYFAEAGECRACGDAPILIALLAAQQLGADRAQVLYRTTSGDVTGVYAPGQYTVGYMAAGVYQTKREDAR